MKGVREGSPGGVPDGVTSVMTRVVARLLLMPTMVTAAAILIKGYIEPGDGFSAGVYRVAGYPDAVSGFRTGAGREAAAVARCRLPGVRRAVGHPGDRVPTAVLRRAAHDPLAATGGGRYLLRYAGDHNGGRLRTSGYSYWSSATEPGV